MCFSVVGFEVWSKKSPSPKLDRFGRFGRFGRRTRVESPYAELWTAKVAALRLVIGFN